MEAQRRNIAAARRLYRAALAVDPAHTRSWVGLGQLEARCGSLGAAREAYKRGLEREPTNAHLLSSLAHMHAQARNQPVCLRVA
jgi:pre-mRNA-processing factor 6